MTRGFTGTLVRLAAVTVLTAVLLGLWLAIFVIRPLPLTAENRVIQIPAGATVRAIADQLVSAGVLYEPYSFITLVRVTDNASRLQAGDYVLNPPLQALDLIETLKHGSVDHFKLQLIEGRTFSEVRQSLAQLPHLRHDTQHLSDEALMQQVSGQAMSPEGWFFPDTYFVNANSSDLEVYQRAYQSMLQRLNQAWDARQADLPYQSMQEALVMASIVEKETAQADERPMIAGVFINRLRKGMRLQTDPTVIYGMGAQYQGNITKKDLLTDTPYNTYTRSGLPPTPIALPGMASIEAALHPADTRALYFVANGKGGHVFSDTLQAHNQAVRRYQLNKHRQ